MAFATLATACYNDIVLQGDGGRYSLLVLLPRAQDGLPKLTEALTKYSFRYLAKNMREKQVDVAIPEFEIDCISHPQAVFKKVWTRNAQCEILSCHQLAIVLTGFCFDLFAAGHDLHV